MSVRLPRDLPRGRIAPYLVDLAGLPEELDPAGLVPGSGPVELEIGFGKGRFLLAAGAARPGVRFLGVEVRQRLCTYTALRLARRGLANVRLVRGDARELLARVPEGALDAVHLLFPDPWWKRRHRRRRIWTRELFQEIARGLRTGGVLHLASDVPEVFGGMCARAGGTAGLAGDPSQEDPLCTTNFEDKALRGGRPVGRAAFVRRE